MVLNMMLETDPDLDKYSLANIFLDEFDRLDSKIAASDMALEEH
ncbi:hypothetical protein PSH79_11505 [Pseudomonas sp. FP2196]|nr:hypothetical protein [Pseudomonas sp. FP2196]WLH37890.1 hypothetical protein PSH79_11505 [Pseudomonas sp. FP2196]